MTLGAPVSQNIGICPVDGTAADVEKLVDKHIDYEKTRYEEWIEAYRYAADQQLAMTVLSQLAQQYFADKALQASLDAAAKTYEIANRQMLIAEEEYQRYKDRFFCNEHNLAQEACDAFDENPDYDTALTRATRNARLAFTPQYRAIQRARSRYCRCDTDKDYCDLATEEAMATVAARNFAYEAEDARAQGRRTYYDNFRFRVADFGRGIQTTQLQTYAAAMPTAVDSINSAARARVDRYAIAAAGVNSVLSAYFSPRIAAPQAYMGGGGGGGFFSSYGNSASMTPYNTASVNGGSMYGGTPGGAMINGAAY